MKHLFKQAGAGLLACALLTCGAQAATITPSAQSVTLDQDQTTFTVDLRLEEEDAFAAAEFGIDVAQGQWYTDAVLWAYEQGLVKGIGGGLFAPDTVVTREQIATILHRQAGTPAGGEDALAGFTDGQAVSDFAAEAVKWAVESGIINGKPGGQLDPQGTATRAEVAALFARALELI